MTIAIQTEESCLNCNIAGRAECGGPCERLCGVKLQRSHSGASGVVLTSTLLAHVGVASVRMPDYVSLWPRRPQTPGLSIGSARFLLLRQGHNQRRDCIEAGTPHSLLGFARTPLSPQPHPGGAKMKPRPPKTPGLLLVGTLYRHWREARCPATRCSATPRRQA